MPAYFFKKTKIALTAENVVMYAKYKELYPIFTGGKHSSAHINYTSDILKTFAENKPQDNEDEKLVMDKSDELKSHIYCLVEHDDEFNRIWFVFYEYFPDEDTHNDGVAWLGTVDIFGSGTDGNVKSVNSVDSADPIVEIIPNTDFHKPYKS